MIAEAFDSKKEFVIHPNIDEDLAARLSQSFPKAHFFFIEYDTSGDSA